MLADARGPTNPARPARVVTVVLLATTAALFGLLACPTRAEATSYRFWTYWTGGDSGWSFATVGASRVPADGSVEGWRFAVSAASTSTAPPRTTNGFSEVCGSTAPVAGSKRVALVVDYGSASDAPPGDNPPAGIVTHCAVVPTSANGYAVLGDYTSLRVETGLVCGIGGYPARGCGEPVSDPPTGDGDDDAGGGSAGPAEGASHGSPDARNSERTHDPDPQPKESSGRTDAPTSNSDRATPAPDSTAGASANDPSDPDATPVAAQTGAAPPAPTAGSPVGVVVGVLAITALGTAALLVSRRRRSQA